VTPGDAVSATAFDVGHLDWSDRGLNFHTVIYLRTGLEIGREYSKQSILKNY
jgi:hypothetical protein